MRLTDRWIIVTIAPFDDRQVDRGTSEGRET
jgi:hypothetical protein